MACHNCTTKRLVKGCSGAIWPCCQLFLFMVMGLFVCKRFKVNMGCRIMDEKEHKLVRFFQLTFNYRVQSEKCTKFRDHVAN